ncbi:MAG: hypothetical protein CM1200mP26_16340 [Acidimicrobiales bacterium]|nr:MAG: hypothetical protein CM1200mP26_16340 [Acidimicrobiales bacterium]
MMSFMQSRLGPWRPVPTARFNCLPRSASSSRRRTSFPRRPTIVFKAAPFVVLISTFLWCWSSPPAPTRGSSTSIPASSLGPAVSSISVIGILMAGWASSSKYSLLGGLRAAGQFGGLRVAPGPAVMGVVIQAGTLNVQEIVWPRPPARYSAGGHWQPVHHHAVLGFAIFLIAVQAELTQPPFDMPVAESEIVTGYLTSTPACGSYSSSSASSPLRPSLLHWPPLCSSAAGTCRGSTDQ